MSIVDARDPGLPATIEADVCIVGAGAAGITLTTQLLQTGRDVCLVESGGFAPDAATQSLYDLDNVGYPQRADYMSRARYFGGSCNLWAGRSMPLSPLDFERRDWVPYSGWPIPYAEVAKYYPAASGVLDLPDLGDVSGRQVPARMSEHEKRIFNDSALAPTVSVWARKTKRFGKSSNARFHAAQNLRVLLNVSATKLIANESGNAIEAIETSTLDGLRRIIRARQFVLACGGLENARLLLVSRDRHSAGIGNQHDLVGRYFMDHPRAVSGRVHIAAGGELPLLRGRPLKDGKLQLGVGLSEETQRRERLLNHYVTFEELNSGYTETGYQSMVQAMKVVLRRGHAGSRWDLTRARLNEIPEMIYLLSPKELMPHPIYRAYVALRDLAFRRRTPRTFVAVYFCEQPPSPDSRATLTRSVDRLGVPRLRLDWRIDDSVRESTLRLQQLVARQLRRTGIGELEASDGELSFTDASHHMGTTRMSASSTQGVVDTDCRVHGIANLFVAGSSVFPCAGHANPTLTLVALSLRLAALLQKL